MKNITNGLKIPHFGLSRQYKQIGPELLQASHEVLQSGVLVGGHYTKILEAWLAVRTNSQHAITCHSGTQALEIIARFMLTKSVDDNPTVYVPNFTYPATVNAWITSGWNVELVDTDNYGIVDFNVVKRENYNPICLVGLYGRMPWYQKLVSGHPLVIDGAQHWLITKGGVWCRGMSISFDPTKNLCASGNGGAIVTNDDELYRFADAYRKNGKPEFDHVGTNSQISEQDAAHILVRAKYIDAWQARRSTIADYWNEEFADLPVTLFNKTEYKEPHAHQKYVIYTQDRDKLYQHLTEYGIEPKVSYDRTISEMLAYQGYENPSMFSVSTMLSRGVISLPMYPELTDSEVEYIKEKVLAFYS